MHSSSIKRLVPPHLAVMLLAIAPAVMVRSVSAADLDRSATGDADGRTYYIDGAGNWGYGVSEVTNGLQRAGYRGRVINFRWSATLNPALDQTIGRGFAKARAKKLGQEISSYLRENPGSEVNIIGLSAGTGVATWACEAIIPPAKLHNLILLGSSLSSTYDIRRALDNIAGGIYVYYSRGDLILQGPVRTLGTIDGKIGVEGAGLVGLHPRTVTTDQIHNIAWSPEYEQYGWTGSHTDGTSEPFVREILSKHIVHASQKPEKATKNVIAGRKTPKQESSGGPTTQPVEAEPTSRPAPILAGNS
jgi:hypothetical protein